MTDRELMQQALDALEYASEETKPENLYGCDCLICKTILALRERLAQPELEPVAWELRAGKTNRVLIEITNNPERAHNWKASLNEVVPLYNTPRQWVGLTDEDIDHPAEQSDNYASFIAGALFAQDKLKEKNS